jgi:hypothetical protein
MAACCFCGQSRRFGHIITCTQTFNYQVAFAHHCSSRVVLQNICKPAGKKQAIQSDFAKAPGKCSDAFPFKCLVSSADAQLSAHPLLPQSPRQGNMDQLPIDVLSKIVSHVDSRYAELRVSSGLSLSDTTGSPHISWNSELASVAEAKCQGTTQPRGDIRSLRLVSRTFAEVTAPFLFGPCSVTVFPSQDRLREFCALAKSYIAPHIRWCIIRADEALVHFPGEPSRIRL